MERKIKIFKQNTANTNRLVCFSSSLLKELKYMQTPGIRSSSSFLNFALSEFSKGEKRFICLMFHLR